MRDDSNLSVLLLTVRAATVDCMRRHSTPRYNSSKVTFRHRETNDVFVYVRLFVTYTSFTCGLIKRGTI